jgi:hypothetical protein
MVKKTEKTNKIKKIKKTEKNNNPISYREFKELLSGLTDEELTQVCDWLSSRQRMP